MKKNLFNTASIIVSALLLTFGISSCKKNAASSVGPSIGGLNNSKDASLQAGKPNTLQTVPLIVTVSNVDGTGTSYNIQNDGKGVYTNGLQNVGAVIDQYGTFAFNTNSASNPNTAAIRWVTYNFNNPVDPKNSYRPSPSNTKNCHFSTGGSPLGTSPFIPLQNLGVNGNPSTECIYMGNGISNSTTTWRVSFHKGYEDVSNSPTAFAFVTRTSISPAVWTITPVGSCSTNSNVAALRSEDGAILFGYYYIPFFFTLRAQ